MAAMSFGFKMLQKFIQVIGTVRVRVNLNIVCDYLYKHQVWKSYNLFLI